MRIVTLIENTTDRDDLTAEHGLSLYIEANGKKILFDAGQSGAFADNAEKLGVDLRQVDFAVLSHGHYDHGGGLRRFLQINSTAPVYVRRAAFGAYHNAAQKYIGLDGSLADSGRLIFTDDDFEIAPGIALHSCNHCLRPYRAESFGLTVREDDCVHPDDFWHEHYLLIEENGKTVCISGCSHKGILNIIQWLQPDVLVGGFHFINLDPEGAGRAVLTYAAMCMLNCSATYYTGHCTGPAQYAFLKERMGERLQGLSTGTEIWI